MTSFTTRFGSLLNAAPDWFVLSLVRAVTGADGSGAATSEGVEMAKAYLKDNWFPQVAAPANTYSVLKERVRQAIAARSDWAARNPQASVAAATVAMQAWSDVRLKTELDAWPHYYRELGLEIVLLQIWKADDPAVVALPMIAVASVVAAGGPSRAEIAFSEVTINANRRLDGRACWDDIMSNGYMKLNPHVVREGILTPDGSIASPARPRRESIQEFDLTDFGEGFY
jgi:hypothetical protein